MKGVFLLHLLLFTSNLVLAQSFNFKVNVKDESGETIPSAFIKLYQGNSTYAKITTQSDTSGSAYLLVEHYPARIEIQSLGFKKKVVTLASPQSGLNITLDKDYTGLSEVVVTGVGRPTRLDQAISVYQIISAADIRSQGAVTLNEALRNQLGLNIGQDMMLGSTISMRGLSGSNVKVLIDGLPLNGREGGNIDMSQINLSNIERIEKVQGPMSVMYGTDALGGVINLITKQNNDDFSIAGKLFYETIGKYNYEIEANKRINKHNISLIAGRNFFSGWDPQYSINETRAPLWRPKELLFGNLKYQYYFNNSTSLTYAMDIARELLVIKSDSSGYYINPTAAKKDAYFNTTRFVNRLNAKWKTGKNGYWESNNNYALYHRTRETFIVDLSTMSKRLSQVTGDQSITKFHDFTFRTTYNNQVGVLDYTLGYDINLEFAEGVDKMKDGSKEIGDYALFLTTNIKPHQKLNIQPAIRAIYNTQYSAPLVPSIGLLYKPMDKLQIRSSYARGFRAPQLKELYLDFRDNNHDIVGNENLKAEYAHHFQLSSAYTLFDKGKYNGIMNLTAFYDDVRNQISLTMTPQADSLNNNELPPYTYANIGRTRFFVLQLSNEYNLDNVKFVLGGSFNKSFETTTTNESGNFTTPDFHYFEVNSSIRYTIPEWKAGIAFFYKYTGSQPMLSSDIMGNGIFGGKTDDFHIIDGSIEKTFWKDKIFFNIGVRNLTNVQRLNTGGNGGGHGSSAMFITPGRSIFSSLRVQIGK